MNKLLRLFIWLNIFIVFLTLLSYLSPFVDPQIFWPLSFCGLAFPWLLLANLLFILFWAFTKKRFLLISAICLALGWNHVQSLIGMHFSKDKSETSFNVMSYNVGALTRVVWLKEKAKEEKKKEFERFFKSNKSAIYCLQESPYLIDDYINSFLKMKYVHRDNKVGTTIFSKFPIKDKGIIKFEKSGNSAMWADILIDEKNLVRVYNVHLQSTKVAKQADKILKHGDLQKKGTWQEIKGVIGMVKYASQKRSAQVKEITKHMEACKLPIILCGDFNDTAQSFAYRQIKGQLKDAFVEKGLGLGITYNGVIPALHIDHVFVDQEFDVLDLNILKDDRFSDHYPVLSTLDFNGK